MRQLRIPYLPWSDESLEHLSTALELVGVPVRIDTLNWQEDFPYSPLCSVRLAWCERGLLVHYFVRGLDLRTLSTGDGHYVHEDSCVECFVQLKRGEAYTNFEFNASGVCYASHHTTPSQSEPLTADEYRRITRWATHMGERIDGAEGMHCWELSALLPWEVMGGREGVAPERLWGNLYKCADGTPHPHYLSWAPIDEPRPAFHRPAFFGELILLPK